MSARSFARRARRLADRRRAGFSMIELMAVIVILLILMAFLLPRLGTMRETVEANATKVFITAQLRAAIAEYENETGDSPRSTWDSEWGPQPNELNLGAELLYVAFWSEEFQGLGMSEDRLRNTDRDSTKKTITSLASRELFELCDDWDNPIAYFHHRDYGRKDVYLTIDGKTGEEVESTVTALTNPRTKSYYNPRSYQLISAGPDGLFGTDDDITNFKR